ncbi:dynamin family protein [Priestia taiwanensis]|uniref:GTP-binding protein n=1 Tax=Priestia taiwanensis TaxID=1347902 RepID=A0A917ENY6_9BACI|nr:dynamin family protein [Priestia taiwanensis]MBM7363259.1 ribosome biogenesis GTPase A [Priestia taiwanensis]GGE68956.1 GTP-binding protein [Priestia taiwanensis]
MSQDLKLIYKKYYETFMIDNTQQPIDVLGEAFASTPETDVETLSPIRFAQGELYHESKDFEAAIFKWEKVQGELQEWAKKNIADIHVELDSLQDAERIYKSISSDNETLTAEVSIQLFLLYVSQGQMDLADKVMKEVVSVSPHYSNVTTLARDFYEEREDIESAVDLAISEGLRTESIEWFHTMQTYVHKGWTASHTPHYFYESLLVLSTIDQAFFEELVCTLWNNHNDNENHLAWITMFNTLFLQVEIQSTHQWNDVSRLYEDTYTRLMGGDYYVQDLCEMIPTFLTSWLRIQTKEQALFVSAAIIAWNEAFPENVQPSAVEHAEKLMYSAKEDPRGLTHALDLFEDITKWAYKYKLPLGHKWDVWANKFNNLHVSNFLIAGTNGNGKSTFINSILEEDVLDNDTASVVIFNDAHERTITEVTRTETRPLATMNDFYTSLATQRDERVEDMYIEFNTPCDFLQDEAVTFIDTPGFSEDTFSHHTAFTYAPLVDGILFVLDAQVPFTKMECDIAKELNKNTPVHFILNKLDTLATEREMRDVIKDTTTRIYEYFPDAHVFSYSATHSDAQQLKELAQFIRSIRVESNLHLERTDKFLAFIHSMMKNVMETRVQIETDLVHSIEWNEDMAEKLRGFTARLQDTEQEKMSTIMNSYKAIKEDMEFELSVIIPQLLQSCAMSIKEDSDFGTIHIELNKEMNGRIHEYLQETTLPKFQKSLLNWIEEAQDEFGQAASYLYEMGDTFNELYEEERMNLHCDFQILEDWQRDVHRMTSRVQIMNQNILLRSNPSQLFLKGVGKILGTLSPNKTIMYNKYKQYVENEEYKDVTTAIISDFFTQFELFEKALDRDIALFFKQPFAFLQELIEEAETNVATGNNIVQTMQETLEAYSNPLHLFKLKVRQYELMNSASQRTSVKIN